MKGFLFSKVISLSHHRQEVSLFFGGGVAFKTKARHLSCCKIGKKNILFLLSGNQARSALRMRWTLSDGHPVKILC